MFHKEDLYQGRSPNISQVSLDTIQEPESAPKFNSIRTVFQFTQFVVALNDVSSENRVFIDLVSRIQQDLSEALRLHTSSTINKHLEAYPDKKSWIDGSILGVQRALNNIGAYMESVKAGEKERGEVRLMHQFEWILRHRQKLVTREVALGVCHQSLMAAINTMQAMEMSGTDRPRTALPLKERKAMLLALAEEDEEILRAPHSRKARRKVEERAHSVPNISLVEDNAETEDIAMEALDAMPTELPGDVPPEEVPRHNLSLRGASGYFPSLPNLAQAATAKKDVIEYHELPGSTPASAQNTPSLPEYNPSSAQDTLSVTESAPSSTQSTPILPAYKPHRLPQYRKPVPKHNSFPTSLPFFELSPSLEEQLAKYLTPAQRRDSVRSSVSRTSTTLSEDIAGHRRDSIRSSASRTSTLVSEETPPAQRPESLRSQASIATMALSESKSGGAASASRASNTTTSLEEETMSPSSDKELSVPVMETITPVPSNTSDTAKPLSTQAKRRRAHTRRLEQAFGGD